MIKKNADLIKKISIFAELTPDDIRIVLSLMKERSLKRDTVLFQEGDTGSEMFIILEGKVAIAVTVPSGEELRLAEMTSGSFFGEMSLIEKLPRSATCRILEDSSFISLDGDGLRALMRDNSQIAEKILYNMLTTTTSRLFNTNALLSDMVQWGEKARLRAITDEYTGLFNRRFLDESLRVELRKSLTTHAPLTMAMVDLDRFGTINKTYGEAFGDAVILKTSEVFKTGFRQGDILARYGGDEFTFLFPDTEGQDALELCAEVCRRISLLEFPEHPEFRITASMGLATSPDHAETKETLAAKADKALYEAKEGGRNRAVLAKKEVRGKTAFETIAERNRTTERIIANIGEAKTFLLIGHELPDEDCISSLVSMALLIAKFGKNVSIYIRDQIPEQLSFLINICEYNKIPIFKGPVYVGPKPDTIFVLDTPKPEMIADNPDITALMADASIRVIEFDHHLSSDAAYSGNEGYCMVTKATSTCELIATFCCKLLLKPELLKEYGIKDLFSRNLVLCMLTGIIADTRFGLTLKNDREIFFYNFFSKHLSTILSKSHRKNSKNYSSMTDISNSIQSLSVEERDIYQMLLDRARYSGKTGYVVLDSEESINILSRVDNTIFVKVVKAVTDFISEQSGTIGLTAYYEMPEVSNLIQFRIRASRNVTGIDLRTILLDFDITDGGGHPGAIGFRMPKNKITDFKAYIARLVDRLEKIEIQDKQ